MADVTKVSTAALDKKARRQDIPKQLVPRRGRYCVGSVSGYWGPPVGSWCLGPRKTDFFFVDHSWNLRNSAETFVWGIYPAFSISLLEASGQFFGETFLRRLPRPSLRRSSWDTPPHLKPAKNHESARPSTPPNNINPIHIVNVFEENGPSPRPPHISLRCFWTLGAVVFVVFPICPVQIRKEKPRLPVSASDASLALLHPRCFALWIELEEQLWSLQRRLDASRTQLCVFVLAHLVRRMWGGFTPLRKQPWGDQSFTLVLCAQGLGVVLRCLRHLYFF